MSIADNLIGFHLPGNKRQGSWEVLEKIDRTEHPSGEGFSAGYKVRNTKDKNIAFLKASDLDLMTVGEGKMFDRLYAATQAYAFERKILEHCQGNNMDRIVTPLDHNESMLALNGGPKELLLWIVFEWANCDARVQRDRMKKYDFGWSITAMHNLATAVQQLHAAGVCHNDIKPSNILVFDELLQKLADLGRAISVDFECLHGSEICLGDPRYASPELLYSRSNETPGFEARKANDLYLLGSVGYYLVTGTMLTPTIINLMKPEHRPIENGQGWGDGFEKVLPYWRQAHLKAMEELTEVIPIGMKKLNQDYGRLFVDSIKQLTEPDPELRGHPEERNGGEQSYSVQRFISVFNRIRILLSSKH